MMAHFAKCAVRTWAGIGLARARAGWYHRLMYHQGGNLSRFALAGLLWFGQHSSGNLFGAVAGTVDTTFNPGVGIGTYIYANVRCFAEQTDGKILFGGNFETYQGQSSRCLARALSTGARDIAFNP